MDNIDTTTSNDANKEVKISAEDGLTGIKFEFPFDLNNLFNL